MDVRCSDKRIVVSGKYITLLDRFVQDFVRILGQETPYVIVSGFVAILFGRSRGTEDVDVLIPRLTPEDFAHLHRALVKGGFAFLNEEDADGLSEMLERNRPIRIARAGQIIPNIEMKFIKDDVDRLVLKDHLELELPGGDLCISPIDIQIAYNLFLGGRKDIEDALYLWEIFRDDLDTAAMTRALDLFGVRGDEYGIGV
ncbi:hypothetical protein [Methanoregula sp.]|uniref:hypothetical protein n=1 Tax=Methanoregula sp. TaxID=2052170 RepID=UPI00236C67F9|nr:hypothetical protein [Methanoregula sp.]MDD1687227.1 hypothetical protein [Methanoregula sp.]